jgi:hypothetical protein
MMTTQRTFTFTLTWTELRQRLPAFPRTPTRERERERARPLSLLFFVFLLFACASAPEPEASPQQQVQASPTIGELYTKLSEQGGYFDSDNLISNESSYLHALDDLRLQAVKGGAYIGVGPDQSFSYVAEIRPEVAFMIDIRRDNMLQHLMFRSLFRRSRNRMEFLAGLIGATVQGDIGIWTDRPIEQILAVLDTAPRTPAEALRITEQMLSDGVATGIVLSGPDSATIRRFHTEFNQSGLEIRYASRGRPARLTYPSMRQLILETDRAAALGSYLSSEERWRTVQDLQKRDRVVLVTGDLAGDSALRRIGNYVREQGLEVTVFYTSNVEQYLFQFGTFENFAANALALPFASNGVIIRSFFNRGRTHPASVPDYMSVQLVQPISEFAMRMKAGGYAGYYDLVN